MVQNLECVIDSKSGRRYDLNLDDEERKKSSIRMNFPAVENSFKPLEYSQNVYAPIDLLLETGLRIKQASDFIKQKYEVSCIYCLDPIRDSIFWVAMACYGSEDLERAVRDFISCVGLPCYIDTKNFDLSFVDRLLLEEYDVETKKPLIFKDSYRTVYGGELNAT